MVGVERGQSETRRAFVAVGFGDYLHDWDQLPNVATDVAYVEQLFTGHGYQSELTHLREGGFAVQVRRDLDQWLLDPGNPYEELVVYWAGHGHIESGHFLIASNSPTTNLSLENAVSSAHLSTWATKTCIPKVTLILDTCFAGHAADKVSRELAEALRGQSPDDDRYVAIIASSTFTPAQDGAFVAALRQVLEQGPPTELDGAYDWTQHHQLIHPESVAKAIDAVFCDPAQGVQARTHYAPIGKVGRRIPNPLWNPQARPMAADEALRARAALRRADSTEHFGPKSRGIDVGEHGWFFTGRQRVLREAVRWLRDSTGGLFVVTGAPGAGKSAVLGRLATLADENDRRLAETAGALAGVDPDTVPEQGAFDLVIHAHGLTMVDVAALLAERFDLPLDDLLDPALMVTAFDRIPKPRPVTLMLDALDEAAADDVERIARNVVAPLSRVQGLRVLVGTRRTRDAFATPTTIGGGGPLLAALSVRDDEIHDLDLEPASEGDIGGYAIRRLLDGGADSPFHGAPDLAQQAAQVIASKAEGSFLAARLHSRFVRARGPHWIENDPRWADELTAGLAGALRADLDRFPEPDRTRVRELLRPLAWARGAGLPRHEVWPAIANELARQFGSGAVYDDNDVTWLLRNAGFYLLEAGEEGRAVYRLYHQFYAEFLRREMTGA